MGHRGVRFAVVTVMVALAAGTASAGLAHAAPKPCHGRPVGLPPMQADSWLSGVSVVSGCDAWAVGGYDNSQGGGGLIEHWTGSSWAARLVPGIEELNAVTALSRTDAWAVGAFFPPGPYVDRALILHWNGKVWKPVPVPDTGHTKGSILSGVSAASPRDVWAVGEYEFGRDPEFRELIEHWNGRTWRRLQGPPGRGVGAYGLGTVTAAAADRVWATGGQQYNSAAPGAALLRWTGRHWHKVRLPRPAHAASLELGQVAAGSAHSAWAVGGYQVLRDNGNKVLTRPVAMHWNGRSWKQTRVPGPPGASLGGVATAAPANVWATGTYTVTRAQHLIFRTLIEHWNGRSWRIVRSPNPGPPGVDHGLGVMAGTTAADMWAIGAYGSQTSHAFVLHCCHWQVLRPKTQN